MESNETDDIEMEGAVEEETMEGKEREAATKVQGAKLLPHHPSPQVVELQRVERELGRQLSKEEHEFVDAQLQMRGIQSIKAANRSDEQSMRLKKLQNFINHAKKRLQDPLFIIKKVPAQTPAQRREAARVRMATPEQKEADRVRLGTPEQREAARVRIVVARAGGLSEDRKRDVEAGRIKNKKSSVYSGDALRNNEVFQGTFIIPALEEDEEDALGQLGNTECRHCGALR